MDELPVIVLGAGGHARVVIDALLLKGAAILGVTAPAIEGAPPFGLPFLGTDLAVDAHPATSVRLVNGLGSIRQAGARREIFEGFKAKGYKFDRVVHPSAVVARNVELGEGVQVMAGAVIQTGSRIGANSIVNTRAAVDHDCFVGAHVHLAPGATLSGDVRVGEGAHIGSGATVIQGVSIGSGALVGAGSVVIRDVASGAVVVGIPARTMNR
jgi:sugar O-acyltransferase (sialic acid O-acetyltransferase NeuD family)